MYLLSFAMHDLWFGTAAMHLADVDSRTPDISPTQNYERDPRSIGRRATASPPSWKRAS